LQAINPERLVLPIIQPYRRGRATNENDGNKPEQQQPGPIFHQHPHFLSPLSVLYVDIAIQSPYKLIVNKNQIAVERYPWPDREKARVPAPV